MSIRDLLAKGFKLGDLVIEQTSCECFEVFYVPREPPFQQPASEGKGAEFTIKLMEFNNLDGSISVTPTRAPGSELGKFKPAHRKIRRISLDGFPLPRVEEISENGIQHLLTHLPAGFKKDFRLGLGFKYEYRFLVEAIEDLTDCQEIVIVKSIPTRVKQHDKTISIAHAVFEEVRKSLNRITAHTQDAALTVKENTAYNIVAKTIGSRERPIKRGRHPLRELFAAAAQGENAALQEEDQEALLKAIEHNSRAIADGKPEKLAKLQGEIELVTLERFIKRYEGMAKRNASESSWQILFNENPFILGLVFGYPIIKVQDQASVGGRKLSGSGDKIADFLVKNSLTDNTAIIEIKKPQTKLIRKNRYREGVYPPTNDLSASIAQTLDQKYQFQSQIAQIKHNSNIDDIESYSVNCCLVIGTTPSEKDQRKSFELFRRNSKDVEVVTFDELLEKLKQLREFLADTGNTSTEL